ncbi:MAG: AMP-binding protein [Bdellovibrionales bacterium]|nr:AMP-binding protein [Bdellovibrionales bacterium]
MIHLWRGFHGLELVELLRKTWAKNELLIVVPPHLKDFGFLELFNDRSSSELDFQGDWSGCTLPNKPPQEGLSARQKRDVAHSEIADAVLGVFTSGTQSGSPRLVFYSRKNVTSSLESIRELFDVSRITRIFVYPQPTHSFGLVLGYLQAILYDLKVDFLEGPYSRKAHHHWFETLDSGTLTLGTPTHFVDLIKVLKEQNKFPAQSYSAIVGGALVTRNLWQRLQKELNIEAPSIGYGATEASPGITHLPPGVLPMEDGDVGSALRGVLVDSQEGLIEGDKEGLLFSSPNLCLAVYENGEINAFKEFLLRDHVSVKFVEGQRRFSFLGRSDLVINRGGVKYSLEMIETRLAARLETPCLAVALYDERLGEELGLLCEASVEPAKIKALVQEEFGLNVSSGNIVFGEIPVNPNKKFDRAVAGKSVLRHRSWEFPIRVEHLRGYLPHRGPAVWIDSIIESALRRGKGRVVVDLGKNYCSQGGLVRESACIEWVAQTYGFTVAVNDILGIAPVDQGTKVFLVEVKNSDFFVPMASLKQGDELDVEAICTHDFGPLKVIEGKIFHGDKLLARVGITLYRE